MSETQVEAYRHLIESGKLTEMQAQVLDRYRELGPCTRRDLVEQTGLMYNNVSGRTNELLEKGLVKVTGRRENSSGRDADLITVAADSSSDENESSTLDDCCRYVRCEDPVETVKTVNGDKYRFCEKHG